MTERIAKILPWLLLLPAVLPLFYIDGLVYPMVSGKTFLLRALGILSLTSFSYLILSGRLFFFSRLRSLVAWIPFALLAIAYIASMLGVDFYRSFWSSFERGDGLLSFTVIVGYFYFILLTADRAFLVRLLKTVAVVGTIAALIGFLQWIEYVLGASIPFLPPSGDRVGGPLGNAAFFAAYLGLTAFATLASAKEWRNELWRKILPYAVAFQIVVAGLTATRGTALALAFALALWLVYTAWRSSGTARRYATGALIALIIAGAFFIGFRDTLSHSSFEPVRRIASISTSDTTVASRLFIWKNVLEEVRQRPLLGVGAEHVQVLFNRFYDPSKIVEQWFDRTHNAFLDYLAQYGVLGFALYGALILAFLAEALRRMRLGEGLGLPFLLLVIVYIVQNFFVFDTAVTLWLFVALFAALLADRFAESASVSVLKKPLPAVGIGAALLLLVLLVPAVWTPLRANLLFVEGYLYHVSDINRSIAALEKGLSLGTYADIEYGYNAYNMYTKDQLPLLHDAARVAAYEYALSILSRNLERYPYDGQTATYLAHVMDSAPPEVTVDETFLRHVLAEAIELSPRRAQPWYMEANISLRKADAFPPRSPERARHFREAVRVFEAYAAMEPTPVARYALSNLYIALDDPVSAKRWADEGLSLYREADVSAAEPAVKYYIYVEDYANAARFLRDLVADNPTDYDLRYDLAKTLLLSGQRAAAVTVVEKLRKDAPGFIEQDPAFLKALGI